MYLTQKLKRKLDFSTFTRTFHLNFNIICHITIFAYRFVILRQIQNCLIKLLYCYFCLPIRHLAVDLELETILSLLLNITLVLVITYFREFVFIHVCQIFVLIPIIRLKLILPSKSFDCFAPGYARPTQLPRNEQHFIHRLRQPHRYTTRSRNHNFTAYGPVKMQSIAGDIQQQIQFQANPIIGQPQRLRHF